jgi:hypothetical protein
MRATSSVSSPVFGSCGREGVVVVATGVGVGIGTGASFTGGVGDSVGIPLWVEAIGAKRSAPASSASAAAAVARGLRRSIARAEP